MGLFDTTGFPPRWSCGIWTDVHGWTHVVSDLAIFAAYVAIPLAIVYFLRKRRDIPFPRIGWLFVAFIFSCGAVHLLEAIIFWYPIYRFSAVVKVITAAVSVTTVLGLIKVAPRAFALPSLAALGERLARESEGRAAVEETFQRFVEFAPNAVLAVDDDGIIRLANRQAIELFGYGRDDLVGASVEMLVPVGIRESHPELRRAYLADPEPRAMGDGELMARKCDGSAIPVEIGLTPIETHEGHRVLCAIADVSERVHARQRLERNAAALERSNADLERFAYVASHDLQEPLRMVSSYLQLVERRYLDELDDDGREFIGFAVDGAKRMQQLINDLLAFSRVGSERLPLTEVSMNAALDSATSNLGAAIEENEAVVTRDELPVVSGHETQLVLLLQNLIGNAIKYRSEQAPRVHVSHAMNGPHLHFVVSDNGIGVGPDYLNRIFEVFARLHGREVPGTGIGLAICKRIVEGHGGRIWAESEPGSGTRIHFTLKGAEQ